MRTLAFDICSDRGDIHEMDVGKSLPTAGLSSLCSSPGVGAELRCVLEAAQEGFSPPWGRVLACHTHGLRASGVTWEQPDKAVPES